MNYNIQQEQKPTTTTSTYSATTTASLQQLIHEILSEEIHVFQQRVLEKVVAATTGATTGATTTTETAPKKKMTSKKLKKVYPDLPTKNKSAYIFYFNEARPTLAKQGLSFNVIGKTLGDQWKSLSDEQKHKYTDMATADRKRYVDEVEKFNEKHSDYQISTSVRA